MKKTMFLVLVCSISFSAFANLGQHLYGKFIISVQTNISTEVEGDHYTDVSVYLADSADVKYDPDKIGEEITRVDFRTNGGTAGLIDKMAREKMAKKSPTSIYAKPTNEKGYMDGTNFSSWPN